MYEEIAFGSFSVRKVDITSVLDHLVKKSSTVLQERSAHFSPILDQDSRSPEPKDTARMNGSNGVAPTTSSPGCQTSVLASAMATVSVLLNTLDGGICHDSSLIDHTQGP
jgi:hypothetical protein